MAEFKDPILYSSHTDVDALLSELKTKGQVHDYANPSYLYHTMPEWITSQDGEHGSELKNMTQIIGSYFDTLAMQIKELPRMRDISYPSASHKPLPFSDRLLESAGFVTSDIFADATIVEELLQIGDKKVYQEKLHNIKNLIYKNIYNNLHFIYKSKGTEKSIRNFVRCFGVDDELIKLNMYANNSTFQLRDNRRLVAERKKYVDFNAKTRNSAVVYQMTGSGGENDGASYLGKPPADLAGAIGMTFECEAVFPKKASLRSTSYYDYHHLTSSIFGIHQPKIGEEFLHQTTWASTDSANFQVLLYRDGTESKNVKLR